MLYKVTTDWDDFFIDASSFGQAFIKANKIVFRMTKKANEGIPLPKGRPLKVNIYSIEEQSLKLEN